MALSIDAVTSSAGQTSGQTYSWSHTCSGNTRGLIVGFAYAYGNQILSGVKYGGVSMTKIGSVGASDELWALSAPASGANTVELTFTGTPGTVWVRGGSISFNGALQTTSQMFGQYSTATGTSSSISVDVVCDIGNIVMEHSITSGANGAFTGVGTDQTSRWERGPQEGDAGAAPNGACSTKAGGDGSTNMSWTLAGSASWGIIAVAIKTGDQDIVPGGVGSGEAFGGTTNGLYAIPGGISTGEALGSPQADFILPLNNGVASAQAFGTLNLLFDQGIGPLDGVPTQEGFGSPNVAREGFVVVESGIPSSEAMGAPQLGLYFLPEAIASAEAFGGINPPFDTGVHKYLPTHIDALVGKSPDVVAVVHQG